MRIRAHIGWVWLLFLLTGCSAAQPLTPAPTAALSPIGVLGEVQPAPALIVTNTPEATPPPTTPDPTTEAEVLAPPAAATPLEYTVQPGDTLLALALHYDIPIAAIQLHNDLGNSTLLHVGHTLIIPPAETWRGSSPFWTLYQVQSGDTLTGIAARYGLDAIALYNINTAYTNVNLDLLSIGTWLILPLDAPMEIAAAPRPQPTPIPATVAPTVAATVAATAPDAPAPTTLPVAPPPPSGDIAAWPAEVFQLVNAERAAAGLPPYAYNDLLALSARLHGEDCQQRGSCNHTGSDGSKIKDRVLRVGYPAAGWAECIVYSSSPAQAVHWWMDEVPPNDWHRRTLLSTWVTEIGIAVVPIPGNPGYYYFIANFGRPQ